MHKSDTYRHIMTFGTFDLFHPGHVYYLTEAQKLGNKMTVVIARDSRVIEKKWKKPIHDEIRRQKNVAGVFSDAQVILGDESDIFQPIREKKPDVLVFWYDQKVPIEELKKQFPNILVARIDGFETDKWKSSILRKNYEE